MKLPKIPPSDDELFGSPDFDSHSLLAIMNAVPDPLALGRYMHWDDLRYRTPPALLSHNAWWLGLRLRRIALGKRLPLQNKDGLPFSFAMIDLIQENLHFIDSLTHGTIQVPDPVTNQDTKNTYIVRSLIEESITSSQIEGASTTREVAKEMIRQGRPPRDRSERMIFNNYMTMMRIVEMKDEKLSKDLVFDIHKMVTDGTLNDPSGAGRFRGPEEPIVIGDDYGVVYHEPPDARSLEDRLRAMCEFANSSDPTPYIHPAIRSVILHFWLAYDHPFVDGNGRTARALFYWSMLRHGYWLFEFISISEIILKAHAQYGLAFLQTETDNNDITYFLVYNIKVIRKSINNLYDYIKKKTQEQAELQNELSGTRALNHRQRELVGHALKHPGHYYTYESHQKSHGISFQTSRTDILGLVERGLLRKRKIGRVLHFSPVSDLEQKLRGPRPS